MAIVYVVLLVLVLGFILCDQYMKKRPIASY